MSSTITRLLDRDAGWIRWWEPAPYRVLDVSFGAFGPPGNRPEADKDTLYASIVDGENEDAEAALRAMTEDAANQFFYAWTCRQLAVTLRGVATELGLPTPPALPAPVRVGGVPQDGRLLATSSARKMGALGARRTTS